MLRKLFNGIAGGVIATSVVALFVTAALVHDVKRRLLL
jgi:hypothetical protein